MIQTLNDIIHKYTVRATSAQYQEKDWNLDSTKKQQEIMSGLNDIEGLPYIIIQSGLPRLNINNKKLELCIEESKSSGCCCKKKRVFD